MNVLNNTFFEHKYTDSLFFSYVARVSVFLLN